MVHFDRPGISYIFCNIHPEMSAVVITLATPFYAVANGEGQLHIATFLMDATCCTSGVKERGQRMHSPRRRGITIAESSTSLGVISVRQSTEKSGAQEQIRSRLRRACAGNLSIAATVIAERHTMKIEKILKRYRSRKESTSD